MQHLGPSIAVIYSHTLVLCCLASTTASSPSEGVDPRASKAWGARRRLDFPRQGLNSLHTKPVPFAELLFQKGPCVNTGYTACPGLITTSRAAGHNSNRALSALNDIILAWPSGHAHCSRCPAPLPALTFPCTPGPPSWATETFSALGLSQEGGLSPGVGQAGMPRNRSLQEPPSTKHRRESMEKNRPL